MLSTLVYICDQYRTSSKQKIIRALWSSEEMQEVEGIIAFATLASSSLSLIIRVGSLH